MCPRYVHEIFRAVASYIARVQVRISFTRLPLYVPVVLKFQDIHTRTALSLPYIPTVFRAREEMSANSEQTPRGVFLPFHFSSLFQVRLVPLVPAAKQRRGRRHVRVGEKEVGGGECRECK